jgi:hypothetical protein
VVASLSVEARELTGHVKGVQDVDRRLDVGG